MAKKILYRIVSVVLALLLVCNNLVLASEEAGIVIEDVTASSLYPVLKGEAKILVSIEGVQGTLKNIQTAINFSGSMQFKGIEYIAAKNNPPANITYSPSSALVNINKRLAPFIVSGEGVSLDGSKTPLYLLTFSNANGDGLTIQLDNDADSTYYEVDGDLYTEEAPISLADVVGSTVQVDEKEANIRLTMDKVTSFAARGNDIYKNSNVSVEIISEKTGYTIYTILNDIATSQGGHRENSTVPAFTIREKVLSDDTYTLRVSGPGYTTVEKKGVTFDDKIELTNADFIPGDMNGDDVIDEKDREIINAFVDAASDAEIPSEYLKYMEAADLNRDGKCDIIDKKIFEIQLKPVVSLPGKMAAPTLSATASSVEVSWSKPADTNITGYEIKYGISSTNMNNTCSVDGADATKYTVTGLSAGTEYYFAVAAKSEAGTGEFSDIVNVKTSAQSSGGGSAGGGGGGSTGGGGSSGGGGGFAGGGMPANPPVSNQSEEFTDLAGYDWAKDAIYSLKEKGIIKGIDENTYSPGRNIKRGDFILILSRMITFEGDAAANFADVNPGSYYYDAILKAKGAGIATGDGVNFHPENMISRQELITLAYRAFLKKGYIEQNADITVLDEFNDKSLIAGYAVEAMASMVKAGIIKGNNGNVNPQGFATRAEVAVMCERLLNFVK